MWLYFTLLVLLLTTVLAAINKPRGVSLSKAYMYDGEKKEFTCLDGSTKIPFSYVNDDYCDCADASDEPGTSACANGSFHCTNAGHRPLYIPSSRVNDGICDCCDGTDEYNRESCPNTCKELGKLAREQEEKDKKLLEEGHQIYLDYVKQGEEAKKENQVKKDALEAQKSEVETLRADLEAAKNEVETPEKEAKDKHKKAWEDEKERLKVEKDNFKASDSFNELDTNKDNIISVEEIQAHKEFDVDSNGEVSPEEAKEYLEENDSVDFTVFVDKVWPNIREIYKSTQAVSPDTEEPEAVTSPAPPSIGDPDSEPPPPPTDNDEAEPDDEDDPDEEFQRAKFDQGDYDGLSVGDEDNTEQNKEEEMPPYDEETKKLIDAAEQARNEFNDIDTKFRNIEKDISDINNILSLDFGEKAEFYTMKGQCYEYTDNEYIYKLCPFDKASQRSKNGGSETSLGRWGHWDGPENKKYSVMKYDKGQNCWNGPDRSVRVLVQCGVTNEVFSASEPNRCEYQFKFSTPAACSAEPTPPEKDDNHDEL